MSNSFLSQQEIEAIQHLDQNTPYLIRHVSQTQLSIARHYGGIIFNGSAYTYDPTTDELVRDDILKFVMKLRKKAKAKP